MLLGMITTMDEEARSQEILSIETLSRLMTILASPAVNAEPTISHWALVGLALDILLSLLQGASSDFLEEASNIVIEADVHLAVISLLEYDFYHIVIGDVEILTVFVFRTKQLPSTIQQKTLRVISLLTSANDDAKVAFLTSLTLLPRLRTIIGDPKSSPDARNNSCVVLQCEFLL